MDIIELVSDFPPELRPLTLILPELSFGQNEYSNKKSARKKRTLNELLFDIPSVDIASNFANINISSISKDIVSSNLDSQISSSDENINHSGKEPQVYRDKKGNILSKDEIKVLHMTL